MTAISVVDGGPLVVRGPMLATDAEGGEFRIRHKAVVVCRCGTSRNNPFCDGSHVKMASGPSRERYALTAANAPVEMIGLRTGGHGTSPATC